MYSYPWVLLAHSYGCNQEFPYFPQIFQYVSTLFPNTESYINVILLAAIWIKRKYASNQQEYVAVSINICRWQNPLQLGIKLKVSPCNTTGCIRYGNCVHQSNVTRSFTDARFVSECVGFCSPSNYNSAPHLNKAILFRIKRGLNKI